MTCRECSEFVADYLAKELDPAVSEIFERHLQLCPNCVTYVRQYDLTIRAAREACGQGAPLPADIPEELIQAILAARRG